MLPLIFRRINKKINFTCTQLSNTYSTKKSKSKDDFKVENMSIPPESAADKIKKCFKRDYYSMKKNLMFWKNHTAHNESEVIDWDNPNSPIFSNYCDILIIGGGAMGSSIAYWCKKVGRDDCRIVVIEKDKTYKKASTVLSVGGLRQQFSLEENIEMSLFGAEFIRNVNDYLGFNNEPAIDLHFHPYGYLSLATLEKAEILKSNSSLQNSLGAKNVILSANKIKQRFPWLTTDDVEIGCLGLEKEGWFDPWTLLCAFRRKAISMGVEYVTAEAKGFNFKSFFNDGPNGLNPVEFENIKYLVVKTEDQKLRPIHFGICIIAAGAFSGDIARMAKIGYGENILSVELPVEPRKRYVYCFHAPDGPGLNTPMTIDPSGVYFRREGLANYYICGRCPEDDEEPSVDNLDVDPHFFEDKIWPVLANRVKAFENLKVKSSWAGYYEYNTFDENGIIGFHPYYHNIMFATGFSGHGIQHAPAVGRAISELIGYGKFKTIDLSRLGFDRFVNLKPMKEINIW